MIEILWATDSSLFLLFLSPGSDWSATWRFYLFSQEGLSDGTEPSRVCQGQTGRTGTHLWSHVGAAAAADMRVSRLLGLRSMCLDWHSTFRYLMQRHFSVFPTCVTALLTFIKMLTCLNKCKQKLKERKKCFCTGACVCCVSDFVISLRSRSYVEPVDTFNKTTNHLWGKNLCCGCDREPHTLICGSFSLWERCQTVSPWVWSVMCSVQSSYFTVFV